MLAFENGWSSCDNVMTQFCDLEVFLVYFSCFEASLLFCTSYAIACGNLNRGLFFFFFILRASFEKQAFWKGLPLHETLSALRYNDSKLEWGQKSLHHSQCLNRVDHLFPKSRDYPSGRETSGKARMLLCAPSLDKDNEEYSPFRGRWMAGSHLGFRWGLQSTYSSMQTSSRALNENV